MIFSSQENVTQNEDSFETVPFEQHNLDDDDYTFPDDTENSFNLASDSFQVLQEPEDTENSTFFNKIERQFPLELKQSIYCRFNKIVELRWGETIPESVFSRISQALIGDIIGGFQNNFSEIELEAIKIIQQFASSAHLQKLYLRSTGGLIEPLELTFDDTFSFQYVPIAKVAALALSNSSLITQIIKEQSPLFVHDQNTFTTELNCEIKRWERIRGKLRIELYFDEFTIVNPIGASRNLHKYLACYCSFTNVPLKDRLKRHDLFLLLLVNHKDLKSFQVQEAVFSRLKNEIEQLCTTGLDVQNQSTGETVTIFSVLSSIAADNLEAYQLSGFPMHFHEHYRCRICASTHTEIQLLSNDRTILGSDDDTCQYWSLVSQSKNGKLPRNKFGLLRTFPFGSQSLHLNPWTCFPPDLSHDLCEGVLPKMTIFLLHHLSRLYSTSKAEIARMFSGQTFYDSKFSITVAEGKFKICGDAVQVC